MLRAIAFLLGLLVAAAGGVMAYRAYFIEPRTTLVITSTDIHEYPSTLRLAGGLVLFLLGALVAFYAARRKPT